ncbi:MAG: flagellar hook-length control protein FliK [Marinobacter sp.]|uniref:flagellar hook-length control protein FliK n=1 Tax=Marinobacter sp. TaxID=50741 RepID=UPI00299EB151|nr:flagellar hook-length control protein FliK [Marinobacter sp.]MDX1756656.1 flagellar hook-length control protein FliK [Marinobacter sp.]
MKLPNGTPPSPPPPAASGGTPKAPTPSPEHSAIDSLASARVQLDQLKLAARSTALARVSEIVRQSQSKVEQLVLEIRGKSLAVNTAIGDTKLEVGDLVKVMRAGNELRLLGKLAPTPQAQIAQALAQRLPWQHRVDTGLAQLMSTLSGSPSASPVAPKGAELPPDAQKSIAQLIARLPTQGSLARAPEGAEGAGQIRQWLADSGLFSEARLAQTVNPTTPDLKLALGRIVAALLASRGDDSVQQLNRLTPITSPDLVQAPLQFPTTLQPPTSGKADGITVGQMLRVLAGMLNRVSVNQLHSQALSGRGPTEGTAPTTTWLMELPWLNAHAEPRLAQLRLEHYEEREDNGPATRRQVAEWRFTLAMELDELGPLYFEVSLRQHQVSARVWAERQRTLTQVKEELGTLQRGLSDLGLEVVDLECRRGQPGAAKTQLEHRLVDTKA